MSLIPGYAFLRTMSNFQFGIGLGEYLGALEALKAIELEVYLARR
ncbi:MAG: hypothetical protein QXW84_04375 [Archaeoglobaceae archaeon]